VKAKPARRRKLQIAKPVLILTVRDDELDAIKVVFEEYYDPDETGLQFQPDKGFYEGLLRVKAGKRVRIVVGQIRDTGNETSGVDATYAIGQCKQRYGRKLLFALLVGICAGSRKRHAQLGDIVVPPYIFDKSVYMKEWRKDDAPAIFNEIRVPGAPDAGLFKLCREVARTGLWRDTISLRRPKEPCVPAMHDDPAVTGNAFLQDGGGYLEECRLSINRKMLAYEMEAGGFANACHLHRVPFLVIRGISDFADRKKIDKTFWRYAARTAAAFALEVAQHGVLPD